MRDSFDSSRAPLNFITNVLLGCVVEGMRDSARKNYLRRVTLCVTAMMQAVYNLSTIDIIILNLSFNLSINNFGILDVFKNRISIFMRVKKIFK